MRPISVCLLMLVTVPVLSAQAAPERLIFNATASEVAPQPVPTKLGSNRAPDGSILSVNSQYLLRDGKAWLPVMGEFHFSRYPEAYWEEEILKMKASGVQIISTYVFWIHHEEVEGQFDWSGQRNLREFAQLCSRHGMLLYPRVGPWAHGEVRNGGLPDWVMKKGGIRSNDPVYLAEVKEFYAQIGSQLHGLLWKDGGPVIGIQIENEYMLNKPGQGREHLAALKELAIASGLDVPLYTVTGWDNAVVPDDLFLPVYGGYPDAPWDGSTSVLPPSEVYAFRFGNRVTSNMGAMGVAGATNDEGAALLRAHVPFLTAEVGGGMQETYHRRPVMASDDIPAMVPVIIGSGANMLGFYMFHGGENPDGKLSTLQESQRTGYPNDLAEKSYDFQAPLGEFGGMNAGLRELKLDDYFLNDFGNELAPARAIEPNAHPSGPNDLLSLRAAARIHGQSGFLFVNNYVRERQMPAHQQVQFEIQLPEVTANVPATPLTVPANSYFYWPVNLDLDGETLSYATAQPILKIRSGSDTYALFQEIPGIPAEFAFATGSKDAVGVERGTAVMEGGVLRVRDVQPGLGSAIDVKGKSGLTHLMLLSQSDAKKLWRVRIGGHDQLVLTQAQVFCDGERLMLRQIGEPSFKVALFPALSPHTIETSSSLTAESSEGIFKLYHAQLPQRQIVITPKTIRRFGTAPTPLTGAIPVWRRTGVAMIPDDASFTQAAEWTFNLSDHSLDGLSDIYLKVHYQGDIARLYQGDRLLTDNLFDGRQWQIGLKRFLNGPSMGVFRLQVLPLSGKADIFFEPGMVPAAGDWRNGALLSMSAMPEYELDLSMLTPNPIIGMRGVLKPAKSALIFTAGSIAP
jgi:hypothetical protein